MIERAKNLLNMRSDKELAAFFGINPSVVASWKRRGNAIPLEYCIKIAEHTGATLDWLILGKGSAAPGQMFYTAPVSEESVPRIERLQKMADWHIEQLHQITLERMREEAKNQD